MIATRNMLCSSGGSKAPWFGQNRAAGITRPAAAVALRRGPGRKAMPASDTLVPVLCEFAEALALTKVSQML